MKIPYLNPLLYIVFLIQISCVAPGAGDSKSQVSVRYKKNCASCHGRDLETFVNREWKYGKSEEAVFATIKYGKADIGMPAFDKAFSDEEIKELVSYILSAKQQLTEDETVAPDKHVTEKQNFIVDTVVSGFERPWSIAWLPDGEMLITERAGQLYRYKNGKLSEPVKGLPDVWQKGQGGLLDIELHPQYEDNGWLYITHGYAAENVKKDGGSTALIRAKLDTANNTLYNVETLFKAYPPSKKGPHYGGRIEFDNDGYLFVTVGDRGTRDNAQKLDNTNGKVHRLYEDGRIPVDNPFYNEENAAKSIWSYGHRNQQGMALHPVTGELWTHEHGPKGGDEINIVQKGLNYGWPAITYGINYNGTIITKDTAKAGMEQPLIYYVPSIAPCGMCFVTSDKYPNWKNNLLVGSLSFEYVERLEVTGSAVTHQEKLLENIGRVRVVRIGPDSLIYVAVERPGAILRLVPVD